MYSGNSDRIAPTSYLSRMFSVVQHGNLRFLVLDCPTESTLPSVLKILIKENVTDVVRVCEPTYSTASLEAAGIAVHDLAFKDGGVPPHHVLHKFMDLVDRRFCQPQSSPNAASPSGSPKSRPASLASATSAELSAATTSSTPSPTMPEHPNDSGTHLVLPTSVVPGITVATLPPRTIAVHCVAGLGRAPALIAVALIEHGLPPLEAIELVRARRRGAFNTAQVRWLADYKPQFAHGSGSGSKRTGSGRGSPRLFAAISSAVTGSVGSGGRRSGSGSPEPPASATSATEGGNGTGNGKLGADGAVGHGLSWGESVKHKLGKLVGGLGKKRSHSALVPPASQ